MCKVRAACGAVKVSSLLSNWSPRLLSSFADSVPVKLSQGPGNIFGDQAEQVGSETRSWKMGSAARAGCGYDRLVGWSCAMKRWAYVLSAYLPALGHGISPPCEEGVRGGNEHKLLGDFATSTPPTPPSQGGKLSQPPLCRGGSIHASRVRKGGKLRAGCPPMRCGRGRNPECQRQRFTAPGSGSRVRVVRFPHPRKLAVVLSDREHECMQSIGDRNHCHAA